MAARKPKAKARKAAKRPAARRPKRARKAVTRVNVAKLRGLAESGLDMSAAAAELGLPAADLLVRLKKQPTLRQAWERGREILELGAASIGATLEQTAAALEITPDELRKRLAADPELLDVRRRTRMKQVRQVTTALLKSATGDKPDIRAARELVENLKADDVAGGVDLSRMRQKDLLPLLGFDPRNRVTIGQWVSRGCPKNDDDGTYDLAAVIRWRLAELEQRLRDKSANETRVDRAKARRQDALAAQAEMRVAAMKEQLLPREAVDAGNVARVQTIKAAILAWVRRMPPQLEGLKRAQISKLLEGDIRQIFSKLAAGQVALRLGPKAAAAVTAAIAEDLPEEPAENAE